MTRLHFLKDPGDMTYVPETDTPHVAFFRKASRVLGWVTLALTVLSLVDSLSATLISNGNDHALHNLLPHQPLSTILCFFLIGIGVLSVHATPRATRWLQSGLGFVVILLSTLSTSFTMPDSWKHGGLTAWVMLLMGFSLAAGGSRLSIIGYVRQSALFVAFFLCGLVAVGHAYGLSGDTSNLTDYVLLPWTSALMGIIAGHALLFQHPNFGVMRLISGEGFGCHIMRRLLPSVILLLLVLGGLLAYGESRNWYPPAFGEGLYAILAASGFSGILLFTAASLNRIDGERRGHEEDLRRSQSQLQSVLDQIPSIICIKDPMERYLMVNREFTRTTGKAAADCVGKPVSEVVPKATALAVQSGYREALTKQEAISSVVTIPQRDGLRTYLSAHFPLLNAAEEAYAVCGVYTDITDIKRQQEEIRALNESLEEKTLRQEAANAELEAFSYSVSHDLRAPLRHIAGFGKLLAQRNEGKLDEKSLHYLNVIETSVSRMGALIDDLLSFSRASKVELAPRRIKTNDLVRDVRAELTAQRPDRIATWEVADLPDMHGDPAMLRLVWVNLLSNAIKYSAKSASPHITVSQNQGEGGEIIFSVRDNGAGFDMRYIDKLFGVFQRLHSAQEYEGTGIGLAMVRRILERHGGRIWAEATPGEGACFYFVVPERRRASEPLIPNDTANSAVKTEGIIP